MSFVPPHSSQLRIHLSVVSPDLHGATRDAAASSCVSLPSQKMKEVNLEEEEIMAMEMLEKQGQEMGLMKVDRSGEEQYDANRWHLMKLVAIK
ncbi:E3 ubiquitin-protein ligase RFWD3 [Pyrus ussuriensis x Pyrus communis]|uniref:E3 ubiquitin-protein ligase RFWD3 n=1 Tax=Pyrus ussuriensis x Pyrus communis TaxID=2448454 RepID=A0A5N5HSW4_9ROSA|nr:E3 ubiquitin-protein ligase RFWD3 [Pyrus ussuriensis x Pyrus communis]